MVPPLRAFALLALLAVARVAAAQDPGARVVSGRVLAADGSSVAGVRVTVRGELAADSAQLDSTGAFSLRVPRFPAGPLELTVRSDTADDRFFPQQTTLGFARPTRDLALILVPRIWVIPTGTYAGTPVRVDLEGATARACQLCGSFYRAPLGDSLPGRPPGIPTWLPTAFPLKLAIDPEVGPRISPRDSIAFWRVAEALERVFGIDLFLPASIQEVLEPEEDDPHGQVVVSVDPTLRVSGWGSTAAQGGDLLAAALMVRSASDLYGAGAQELVTHELVHVLGFGHTCSWRSVVSDRRCPGMRAHSASPEDVAHAQLLWSLRAVERRVGTSQSVQSTLAALRPRLPVPALP